MGAVHLDSGWAERRPEIQKPPPRLPAWDLAAITCWASQVSSRPSRPRALPRVVGGEGGFQAGGGEGVLGPGPGPWGCGPCRS